jgi:hypothetical protein
MYIFDIKDVIIKGERLPLPTNTPEWYNNLIIACWDSNPTKRPSFSNICDIISCFNKNVK